MTSTTPQPTEEKAKTSVLAYAKAWGESPTPPTALATLILAQSLRPPQPLPLVFPPILLFASYLNLSAYPTEAAGISAAWSGLYLLLARRRRGPSWASKFGTRGLIRGATMGVAGGNLLAGGVVYALGREGEEGEGT